MSHHLSLQFFGPPQIHVDGALIVPGRRTVTALLAYLTISRPQRHTREFLSSFFWAQYDQTKAFTNLRHTLWEVRQSIGEGWLLNDHQTIRINPDAKISIDTCLFHDLLEKARHQIDHAPRLALLIDAVSNYQDHLLNGFRLRASPDFNEWAFSQAQTFRDELTFALTMLVESYCALEQPRSAIPHARRLIATDPLNENAHCQLMGVYLQAGQLATALKQCQTCRQILNKELGVDLKPETCNLYQQILGRKFNHI